MEYNHLNPLRAGALGYPAGRDRPSGPLPLRTSTFRSVQQIKKNALTSTSTSRTHSHPERAIDRPRVVARR
jgi:hypothetical protein